MRFLILIFLGRTGLWPLMAADASLIPVEHQVILKGDGRISIWAVLCLALLFLYGGLPARADSPYEKVTVGDHVAYVVPMEVAQKPDSEVRKFWLPSIWPPIETKKIEAFWTPTERDIAASREEIIKYLKAARTDPEIAFDFSTQSSKDRKPALLSAQHEIALVLDNFKNYEAQYIGINVNGQKCMICNYFDLEHLPPDFRKNLDPTSRIVDVNDGGHMYWHFEYIVISRKCMHLSINGQWEWEVDSGVIPRGNQVMLQGDWTPTKEETDKALEAVATYVQNISFKNGTTPVEKNRIVEAKIITSQIARSCVQFIGQTLQGRKVIYCNFFPVHAAESASPSWEESEVHVGKDGGPEYWQIYYDPKTGKCSDLHVNGEA